MPSRGINAPIAVAGLAADHLSHTVAEAYIFLVAFVRRTKSPLSVSSLGRKSTTMKVFPTNFGLQICLWQHLVDFTVPQVSYHSLDQAELPSQHSNISLPKYASNVAYNRSGLNRLELSIPMFRGFNIVSSEAAEVRQASVPFSKTSSAIPLWR